VVISIIVILMSILLPALKYARSVVGLGVCAGQIRKISGAFHAYMNEFEERIPWNSTAGNMETYQTICWTTYRPSGFGCLYETKLVEDHHLFYCPDCVAIRGQTADSGPKVRQDLMDNYQTWFADRSALHRHLRCDYVMGYWIQPGCGPWPARLAKNREGDKFEVLKKDRVAWMADGHDWAGSRGYNPMSHDRWKYMNVGMLDASVRGLIRYMDKLPKRGIYGYYWPYNDRPMWGWWEYFGVGKGL